MMNDPVEIAALLIRVNKACARMNAGLSAFASVLAVLVLFMGVMRATEYANAMSANAPLPYSTMAGQPLFGLAPYN